MGGPSNKDYSILGSILGSPFFWDVDRNNFEALSIAEETMEADMLSCSNDGFFCMGLRGYYALNPKPLFWREGQAGSVQPKALGPKP